MIDLHTPDFLLLTETPTLPHHGALTHALNNKVYKIDFHQVKAPSPPDITPEARLPIHITHKGGGC